jgi:hypothetical protein
MAAEAEGLPLRPLDGNHKTCLTRIGLLMEGVGRIERPILSLHVQQRGPSTPEERPRVVKTAHTCRRTRSRLICWQIGNGLLPDKTKVWCFYDLRTDSNDDYPDVYFVAKQIWRLSGEITQER